jgi:hypothetical protein
MYGDSSQMKFSLQKTQEKRRKNGELGKTCGAFALSPSTIYFFLELQLFVRISLHLSSPGIKSNPQEGCEGMLDEV